MPEIRYFYKTQTMPKKRPFGFGIFFMALRIVIIRNRIILNKQKRARRARIQMLSNHGADCL